MPLNSNQVKSLQPGAYADGGGLYLIVRDSGERVWAYRFTAPDGKRGQMEFAKVGDRDDGDKMTLSTARETARDYKVALKRDGTDPRIKKQLVVRGGTTFKDYAEKTYPGWCIGKSKDEPKQWARSIRDVPSLHALKLHEIDNTHVITALKPIWWEKPITADRTRQRIEKLLDAAKVEKLRTGENPAAWRGNLKFVLPSARKLNKKKGHASAPYAKAPQLMNALRFETGNSARCVEVGILTCTRSQEIRWMEWDELDFDKKTWLIPGWKMKIKGDTEEGRPHLTALSDQAIAIIQSMPRVGKYVFPSEQAVVKGKGHEPFLANALTGCITRTGIRSSMHGCRTMFRNWGADSREHNFRREVLEFCLSHRVGDEAELSYWTSEMLDRRREVMEAWSDFVKPKGDTKGDTKTASKAKAKSSLRLVA